MKEQIRVLQIIHLSLCASLIFIYIILGNLFSKELLNLPEIDTASLFYLFIPVMAYIASNFVFKTLVKKIDAKQDLQKKITHYTTASIIRWAIIEASAFIILFLKPDFIMLGLLLIIYLFLLRPTTDKINTDLENISL